MLRHDLIPILDTINPFIPLYVLQKYTAYQKGDVLVVCQKIYLCCSSSWLTMGWNLQLCRSIVLQSGRIMSSNAFSYFGLKYSKGA